jgi:3-hydroxy acid dehydrogenase/malonic semialdehyde reductase
VLINNAGLSQGMDPINAGSTTDWEVMIDTNIKGLLYVTKVVSNWMIKHKSGHIVNLGSIAGKETYLNGNVYCATKHAVDS